MRHVEEEISRHNQRDEALIDLSLLILITRLLNISISTFISLTVSHFNLLIHFMVTSHVTLFNKMNSNEESKGKLLPLKMSSLINA